MSSQRPIPLWVNLLMLLLVAFMGIQVFWFYFDHQTLLEAGISINGAPDLNVLYSTASRLLAMIAVTVFVITTQNPQQYMLVLLLSIFREGQEMFIDPLFPYADAPASPMVDFGIHAGIVTLEIIAFVVVLTRARRSDKESAHIL